MILTIKNLKESSWNGFANIYKELIANTEEILRVFFWHWALKEDVSHSELNDKQFKWEEQPVKDLQKWVGMRRVWHKQRNVIGKLQLVLRFDFLCGGSNAYFSYRPDGGSILKQTWFPIVFQTQMVCKYSKAT